MKQTFLSFVLALLPIMASADVVELGGIWYTLNSEDKTAAVIPNQSGKYSGPIEIPDKVIYNKGEYSVTKIREEAFYGCSGLTSVTFGNNMTLIQEHAFQGCSGLTSITIPNSVTLIEDWAFSGCSGLTSVTIGKSSIGSGAFYGCSNLTTVTIGNGRIFHDAFEYCTKLTNVYCMAENLYSDVTAFLGSSYKTATLHVPASEINAYKTTQPWSEFGKIVTLSGEEPETQKCATPTISIEDGKIKFSCETEGVKYVSNISTTDARDCYDPELTLTYKYKVTVYATKDDYENSDTATREITITENGKAVLVGDVDGDGKVNVADHVELSKIIMEQ